MKKESSPSAIHHITAITSNAAENLRFYTETLGLRLVKKTVNFDDPSTYHFYYADGRGTPGTILTFFPWENMPQGRTGAGMVTAVAFSVHHTSLAFWTDRLRTAGVQVKSGVRFGEPVLCFSDPHGLPLEIVGVYMLPDTADWQGSPIERIHTLSGFHSATTISGDLNRESALLMEVMGLQLQDQEKNRYRFETAEATSPGAFFDLVVDPQAAKGLPGSGTVHHIAFRCRDDADQKWWQQRLRRNGFHVTEVRDRTYFRSIYFHTPEGILFEIATDSPGFTIDEPLNALGETLKLPTAYQPYREQIVSKLPMLSGTV